MVVGTVTAGPPGCGSEVLASRGTELLWRGKRARRGRVTSWSAKVFVDDGYW
jgi:hypothetical protein